MNTEERLNDLEKRMTAIEVQVQKQSENKIDFKEIGHDLYKMLKEYDFTLGK